MTFAEAPVGSIVEMLDNNGTVASGRCYKKVNEKRPNARKRFTKEPINIHPGNKVRVIDPTTIDGF